MQMKKSTPKIKKTEKFIYLDIYSGKAKVKRPAQRAGRYNGYAKFLFFETFSKAIVLLKITER
jgi:hypothetical protein